MAQIDIAFYTTGDTRSPDSQPRSRRSASGSDGRIPYRTISEMYRAYAQRVVSPRGRVFGVSSSGAATATLRAWSSSSPADTVGNVYFIGHGNRGFAWSVSIGADGRSVYSAPGGMLVPHVTYHGGRPAVRRDEHYHFLTALERAMGDSAARHRVEIRACFLDQAVVDATAVAIGLAATRRRFPHRRVEVRSYEDFFAIIPSSAGGFRAEIQNGSTGAMVRRAQGVAAPEPQLFACVSSGQVQTGARCQ